MSVVFASFLDAAWYTWAIPLAAAAIAWTFVFLVLGRRREGE